MDREIGEHLHLCPYCQGLEPCKNTTAICTTPDEVACLRCWFDRMNKPNFGNPIDSKF